MKLTKTITESKRNGGKMEEQRNAMLEALIELKSTLIEDRLPTILFQEGIDYEIVSMGTKQVQSDELLIDSLDDLTGKSSQLFFQENNISNKFHEQTISILGEMDKKIYTTPKVNSDVFYLINEEIVINFDLALTFGLGVVKILHGKYEGRYMFYDYIPVDEEDVGVTGVTFFNLYNETLMLLMYFQYTNPDKIDGEQLMFKISENWYLDSLILRKREEVCRFFSEILMPKKDESNLIGLNLF